MNKKSLEKVVGLLGKSLEKVYICIEKSLEKVFWEWINVLKYKLIC